MVYSYSYLSVIFKVSWSTDVAQNFQNSLIRSIHILASLIYSPGICFYDKYKDSFTHVRVLLYIWYGETVHKRKNVNRGPRSNFLAECVPRPIKFGQPRYNSVNVSFFAFVADFKNLKPFAESFTTFNYLYFYFSSVVFGL